MSTLIYKGGGGGGQKWPKSCLRSKSMTPYGIELVFSFCATLFFPHSLNALVSNCQNLLGH